MPSATALSSLKLPAELSSLNNNLSYYGKKAAEKIYALICFIFRQISYYFSIAGRWACKNIYNGFSFTAVFIKSHPYETKIVIVTVISTLAVTFITLKIHSKIKAYLNRKKIAFLNKLNELYKDKFLFFKKKQQAKPTN